MDEVKIWTIEESQASPVQSIGGMDCERRLEKILVNKPELLMPGLTLVGRQTQTKGGMLDLLGVDSDGRLVVFELKRGTLSRDAIAQIIDYASYLEDMDLATLVKYISDKSGTHGIGKIDDFEEWYTENTEVEDLESLRPLRMFLVGLGADDRTERMVNFLANRNVHIELLTFHGFTYKGKTLLARQVHQEGSDGEDSVPAKGRRLSSQEHQESLDSRIKKYDVSDLFDAVEKMFQKNWVNPRERSNQYGLNFRLPNRSKTGRRTYIRYARINAGENQLRVVFFSNAIGLCVDDFKSPIQKIPFETHPHGHEANARKDLTLALENCPNLEIQFVLPKTDWETHKEKRETYTKKLDELTHAVYNALPTT